VSNSGEGDGRTGGVTDFHPIAKVSVGQILGLVEAIDEVGGVADVATISQEVDMDLDRLGPVLGAAEFLGLMTVDEGDVRITDLSRKLLHANVRERQPIGAAHAPNALQMIRPADRDETGRHQPAPVLNFSSDPGPRKALRLHETIPA